MLMSEPISFRALSLISSLKSKQVPDVKSALDLFATRTLMAYQSLSNPVVYKSEHQQMLQLCSSPFRLETSLIVLLLSLDLDLTN